MNPLIVMGAIAITPVLLISFLKAKASIVFLALCAGSVLNVFVGDAIWDFMQLFVRSNGELIKVILSLSLLLLPPLMTIVLLRGTVNGAKFVTNFVPAILTGVTLLFLIIPLLSGSIQSSIYESSSWDMLLQYQGVIVGSTVFISLMQLWMSSRSARHKKGKHKK
jgi:hypothetical protein